MMTFLTALFHPPLANATAINMAAPLCICCSRCSGWASALVRHALAGHRHPGLSAATADRCSHVAGFNGCSVCLLSTFSVACRDLYIAPHQPRYTPSGLITIGTAIASPLPVPCCPCDCRAAGHHGRNWPCWPPRRRFLSSGYMLLIRAMRQVTSPIVRDSLPGLLAADHRLRRMGRDPRTPSRGQALRCSSPPACTWSSPSGARARDRVLEFAPE